MTFIKIPTHRNFVSGAETKFRYRNRISVPKFRLRRRQIRYRTQNFGTEMVFRRRNFVSRKNRNQFATEFSIGGGDRFKPTLVKKVMFFGVFGTSKDSQSVNLDLLPFQRGGQQLFGWRRGAPGYVSNFNKLPSHLAATLVPGREQNIKKQFFVKNL